MYQDPLTLCSFYFLKAFSQSDYPLWEKLSRKSPWWKNQGQEWVDKFREILINHRNICYDWRLDEQEKELWNLFYNGNVFLVECLQGEGNISSKVKQEIESTLLSI